MRIYVPLLALLAVACSSESTEKPATDAPAAKEGASTSAIDPSASEAPKETAATKAAEATLNEKQVDAFFTKFGKKIGHTGLTAEDRKGLIGQITSVPVGQEKSAPLHLDHKGQHVDVTMTVKHVAKDSFLLKFEGTQDDLIAEIQSDFKSVAP